MRDLKKIEGLHFDGSKCATCPTNCCIVHDPDEQYIAIREDELTAIYDAYPEAPSVRATKRGKDGRRYYTVTKKGARCAFLGDDLRCAVYTARPRYCRENPGNAYQLHGWDGVRYDVKRCPGTTYD
ncbi:MAG TPA: YkgJ family cysteine cluster protein, partial [Candidatus Acidoferrales bacterium]|nr:YkgJ family cysteine cluster protein [Candidatus Acidoferrales bacterium]